MHLDEGEIRALIDHQLLDDAMQAGTAHLENCPACRAASQEIQLRSRRVAVSLESLDEPHPPSPSPGAAYARFEQRLKYVVEKEQPSMTNKLFNRVPRSAWVALVIVAVLGVALAFEPVRAVANSFLGLFRVEQVRIVRVDPAIMQAQMGETSQLEEMLANNVQFSKSGELQKTDSANQASQLAGFTLRLPAAMKEKAQFVVQPGGQVTFNVDLKLVQSVLADLGRSEIALPEELDGSTVTINISTATIAMYGDCDFEKEAAAPDPDDPPEEYQPVNCTTLMQMPSPTITAPPGLNLAQIGEAYLQLLGMNADEAAAFARNVDWTTTFVIPIPRYGADYSDVQVDGVTATLVEQTYRQYYALLWVKNGMLYVLSGPGAGEDALEIAASLK